ncbi:peptidyl-prolyl cis-trans isomerase [Fretibacter rubidus]|uniref:peptidylprolyl isomerase n=1 Tax=Fretibacter rubidus TaxID=570162 RepID=UPI00352A8E72
MREQAPSDDSYSIVVTVPQVERMVGLWTKTWGRPPSDQELQGLVRDHIKEEIYYREARRLGLEQNDVVIRRRLRQKMEFLSADIIDDVIPDEATLRAYYNANQRKYSQSAVFDIDHIYYKANQKSRAKTDLVTLSLSGRSDSMGDSIALPPTLDDADERQIARVFGSQFWTEIQNLPEGIWRGPVESGFGLHLVKINKTDDGGPRPFDSVKDAVARDWQSAEKLKAQNKSFETLMSNYNIDIEMPSE